MLLAESIGVTTQSVYEWRRGISAPGAAARERIEALTGIRPSVWMTDEEREAVRAHARMLRRLRKARGAARVGA